MMTPLRLSNQSIQFVSFELHTSFHYAELLPTNLHQFQSASFGGAASLSRVVCCSRELVDAPPVLVTNGTLTTYGAGVYGITQLTR